MKNETKPIQEKTSRNNISICDLMQENTSTIIKKMESQIPTYLQLYSDTYKEYLHMVDDLYGTCYISEKEFFDKFNVEQNTLKVFDDYWKNLTKMYLSQIDMSTNFLRAYAQIRISTIKSYDRYMHVMMTTYAKMLSQFNSMLNN